MHRMTILGAFAALALAGTAHAVTYNSTPNVGWQYGLGNDYDPANTAVLQALPFGDQLYLRAHQTYQPAPASAGKVYSFGTAVGEQISFDWGFDAFEGLQGVTALITLKNYATGGSFSYDPLFVGNDNTVWQGHSPQNSFRLNWANNLGTFTFNPALDGLYNVKLAVNGLPTSNTDSTPYQYALDIDVKLGNGISGGAVPEPAAWALMIIGFGATGTMLRRRSRSFA